MITMTNEELRARHLQFQHLSSNSTKHLTGEVFREDVLIDYELTYINVVFESCVFEFDVLWEKIDIAGFIEFRDCEFKTSLSFSNITVNGFSRKNGYGITFGNCRLNILNIDNCGVVNGLDFTSETKINNGNFLNVTLTKNGFSVNNSFWIESWSLSNCNFNSTDFKIINSAIACPITIDKLTCENVFLQAKFKNRVTFIDLEVAAIELYSLFESDFKIHGLNCSRIFDIKNSEFKESCRIKIDGGTKLLDTHKIRVLSISETKFRNSLILSGNDSEVRNLNIENIGTVEGELNFVKLSFFRLILSGLNKSILLFDYCEMNRIDFENLYNNSIITFSNCAADGRDKIAKFSNVDFGKTRFMNFDLGDFQPIELNNVSFVDVVISGNFSIPENKLNIHISDVPKRISYMREVYRQLKHASEKNGNRVLALHYSALEMKYYRKEISYEKSLWGNLKSVDWWILLFSRTNNYGLNFGWALGWFIGISLMVFFLLLVSVLDELSFCPNLTCESLCFTVSTFWNNFNKYFQLMDPTVNLKNVFAMNEFTWQSQGIHLIFKVVLAFFTFQIISAFRKFVKN